MSGADILAPENEARFATVTYTYYEQLNGYLQAGLIDSLHFTLAPVALGQGDALLTGLDLPALGFSVTEHEATEHATDVVLEKLRI